MKKCLLLLGSLFFLAIAGCAATAIHDTAPAGPSNIYAVGHKANLPTIWKCPTQAEQGKCKQITVVEHNK